MAARQWRLNQRQEQLWRGRAHVRRSQRKRRVHRVARERRRQHQGHQQQRPHCGPHCRQERPHRGFRGLAQAWLYLQRQEARRLQPLPPGQQEGAHKDRPVACGERRSCEHQDAQRQLCASPLRNGGRREDCSLPRDHGGLLLEREEQERLHSSHGRCSQWLPQGGEAPLPHFDAHQTQGQARLHALPPRHQEQPHPCREVDAQGGGPLGAP
mmetsp:Transcript_18765/g.72371  ORF Transcript_18765/g.72371 Transcript_18765/m.72371 type:complete len:212 (+) Transcript_18765:406-1041(+)